MVVLYTLAIVRTPENQLQTGRIVYGDLLVSKQFGSVCCDGVWWCGAWHPQKSEEDRDEKKVAGGGCC